MSEELKACPFCGSSNVNAKGWVGIDHEGDRTAGPECSVCGATAQDTATWNERATPQPAEALGMVEALREIAEQDDVELALDPQWAKRIASAALSATLPPQAGGGEAPDLTGEQWARAVANAPKPNGPLTPITPDGFASPPAPADRAGLVEALQEAIINAAIILDHFAGEGLGMAEGKMLGADDVVAALAEAFGIPWQNDFGADLRAHLEQTNAEQGEGKHG